MPAGLEPRRREELPELTEEFQFCEEFLGFLPNDILTLAHVPELVRTFMAFCRSTYEAGDMDLGLLQLVGVITSSAAGCRYCTAHMAQTSPRFGVPDEKVAAVWQFETSDLFTEAERAALRLAFHAGQSPSAVIEEDFQEVKRHYSTAQIVQLMSVVCLFGFLNRWNDSFATELEKAPRIYAEKVLSSEHWQIGKHGHLTLGGNEHE